MVDSGSQSLTLTWLFWVYMDVRRVASVQKLSIGAVISAIAL